MAKINAAQQEAGALEMFRNHRLQVSETMPAIRWSEPGSMCCGLDYLLFGGTLLVLGDFGRSVYCWSGPMNFFSLGRMHYDYFSEKLEARDPCIKGRSDIINQRQWIQWFGLKLAVAKLPDDYVMPRVEIFPSPVSASRE